MRTGRASGSAARHRPGAQRDQRIEDVDVADAALVVDDGLLQVIEEALVHVAAGGGGGRVDDGEQRRLPGGPVVRGHRHALDQRLEIAGRRRVGGAPGQDDRVRQVAPPPLLVRQAAAERSIETVVTVAVARTGLTSGTGRGGAPAGRLASSSASTSMSSARMASTAAAVDGGRQRRKRPSQVVGGEAGQLEEHRRQLDVGLEVVAWGEAGRPGAGRSGSRRARSGRCGGCAASASPREASRLQGLVNAGVKDPPPVAGRRRRIRRSRNEDRLLREGGFVHADLARRRDAQEIGSRQGVDLVVEDLEPSTKPPVAPDHPANDARLDEEGADCRKLGRNVAIHAQIFVKV
jgi:hypothetical protein